MNTQAIKPDDILADNENFVALNGVEIRKGSIAAFLKNIDLIENINTPDAQKNAALAMLKELAPAMIELGLHKHTTFKNKIVEEILNNHA
jgi:hypothetical protein